MSYHRYQNALTGWGSDQFRFGPPPAFSFQPQQAWGGWDYYNAYASHPRSDIYHHAMNRISSDARSLGVGKHEARHWHRRAYGGLGDIARMLPSEIGHAAGYEAYRSWIHNSPAIDTSFERQREILVSLAIAEAAQLWESAGRGYDQYALQTASETAAATASLILSQSMDAHSFRDGHHRSRSNSFSSTYSYADAYATDDMALMQRGGVPSSRSVLIRRGSTGGIPIPHSHRSSPVPIIHTPPSYVPSPVIPTRAVTPTLAPGGFIMSPGHAQYVSSPMVPYSPVQGYGVMPGTPVGPLPVFGQQAIMLDKGRRHGHHSRRRHHSIGGAKVGQYYY